MENQVLFISSFFPEALEDEFLKHSKTPSLDYATHNLQRAIIHGFEENGADYYVVNVPHLGSFPPYYKTPFVHGYKSDDNKIESISYLNITWLKRANTKYIIRKKIKKWLKERSGVKKTILLYSYDYLSLCHNIKRWDSKAQIVLLAADLPEFMSTDNSLITKANKIISKFIKRKDFAPYIDGYVLLAPAMKERLPVGNKPWIQIEGIYNPEHDTIIPEKAKHKVVLYTGHLARRYGIEDLLKSFHLIDNTDYRLWICGMGDGIESIKEYEKIDTRIHYLGTFKRDKIISLQKQSTLLINPRHSKDEYTMYSFPSKTMEYMASGTPTLMSHLHSIPKEYDKHLYYFEDESIMGMSSKIISICETDKEQLKQFGSAARNFILMEKTPKPQVRKLLQFIYSLN